MQSMLSPLFRPPPPYLLWFRRASRQQAQTSLYRQLSKWYTMPTILSHIRYTPLSEWIGLDAEVLYPANSIFQSWDCSHSECKNHSHSTRYRTPPPNSAIVTFFFFDNCNFRTLTKREIKRHKLQRQVWSRGTNIFGIRIFNLPWRPSQSARRRSSNVKRHIGRGLLASTGGRKSKGATGDCHSRVVLKGALKKGKRKRTKKKRWGRKW